MPRFARVEFSKVLSEVQKGNIAPVYLLYGESFLVSSAVGELVGGLAPGSRSTNLETLEGGQADFRRILDSLNTFALFSGRKVIVIQDCRIFYSRANLPDLISRSNNAFQAGDQETAARLLLEILAYAGWTLEDVAAGAWRSIPASLWHQALGFHRDEEQLGWLDPVADYASEKGMQTPERRDDAALLEAGLKRGFPAGHCLVLTTDTVDKRRSLYRLIEDKGVVLDFTVASGSGRQARSEQQAVLKDLAADILASAGKQMAPEALALLVEKTGFNLWAFRNQLQKLISFVGPENISINREDVETMSHHLREEAIYELSNAVTSGDLATSLELVYRLLNQGYHPLQLLAGLVTEVRRLVHAREFIDLHLNGNLDPRISYGAFQRAVHPLVSKQAGDRSPLSTLHPFALHRTMSRSAGFQPWELATFLRFLLHADLALKSTGLPQRQVLEEVVIRICNSC